jgi:predicted DNA-binding antitoxin AbrB/MazE fold protein
MPITCEAIVENGRLRPLSDLGLTDLERVKLTVERLECSASTTPSIEATLLDSGLFRLAASDASALAGRDVSGLSLDALNRALPIAIGGKPLSATIIEERSESW